MYSREINKLGVSLKMGSSYWSLAWIENLTPSPETFGQGDVIAASTPFNLLLTNQ